MLYKLAYISRRVCDEEAVRSIGADAQVRNRADVITGVLLEDGRHFLQLLEGDHDALARCYLRIAADTRHARANILVSCPAETRLFADWDLAMVKLRPGTVSLATVCRRMDNRDAVAKLNEIEALCLNVVS